MDNERRDYLRRRYSSLGWGEWSAAAVFAGVTALVLDDALAALGARTAVWWALMPLLVVLLQAGGYWLAARHWVGIGVMPHSLARLFLALRVLHIALLVASLAGIVVSWPSTILGGLVTIAVWLFAVTEYVNYYVVRLAYRPGQWWSAVRERRAPQLMVDVRESLGSAPTRASSA